MNFASAILSVFVIASVALGQAVVNTNNITAADHSVVPRFSALYTNNLVVPASTAVTLPATFDYDAIEVAGTLKLSRDYDTSGTFINIQVLPGGSLDFGSEADPVLKNTVLVVKDSPLLTGVDGAVGPDPEQFGSGITVFGEWKSYGRKLDRTWTTMQPVAAGTTTLTLSEAANWQAGDKLLFFDTRPMGWSLAGNGSYHPPDRPSRRETATIAAINGQAVTLTTPMQFEHGSYRDHNEQVVQLPPVANITRNIIIRSENPNGVRGHAMFMDMAHVNLYYTAFIDLGRTLPIRLDNYDSHTGHIGTNQVARYAVHWHHVHGHADAQELTGRFVGNYSDGGNIAKWNQVQHGTHDLLIEDNIGERFVGASFITEDGYEVRGQYRRNLAAFCKGNGGSGKLNVLNTPDPTTQNAPGAEGAGFWFHGSKHTVTDNLSINNAIGFNNIHIAQVEGRRVPSVPGGKNDTHFTNDADRFPMKFERNQALSNVKTGIEQWRIPSTLTVSSCDSFGNGLAGFENGSGEPNSMKLRDCRGIGVSSNSIGILCSSAYTTAVDIEGGFLVGFNDGAKEARSMRFKNVLLANNRCNFQWSDFKHLEFPAVIDRVTFQRGLPTTQHIVLGQGGNQPFVYPGTASKFSKLFQVINWQGSGKNYRLYENFVAPGNAVALDGLLYAKAVEVDAPPVPVNNPPVVSEIIATPPDVDPAAAGVQDYARGAAN